MVNLSMKAGALSACKMKKSIEDQKKAQHLHSFEGFNKQFETFMGMYATYRQAYEATEALHERLYEYRKYSNWHSFFNCRYRKLKK